MNTGPPETQKVRVKRVGNYIIGKVIGEGSFSKVRVGTHVLTNERVALKIIEKAKITEASDIERITREIQILKLIDHPNIIKLYEVIDTPRHVYLIQEFIGSGELFDYITARGKLSEKEAAIFLCQILRGLDYLHRRKVSHRDLKPENILMTNAHGKYQLKIIDFGLSNIFKETFLKTACGSPAYACPEMIQGRQYVGPNADVWSTGIILYAMLCGCLPFESSTTQGLYMKILSGDFFVPEFLTAGARDVLKSMICVDPEKRIRIPDLVKHPWIIKHWSTHCLEEGTKTQDLTDNRLSQPSVGMQQQNGILSYMRPILDDRGSNADIIGAELDFVILLQMNKMKLDCAATIQGLFLGKHNAATATYTLLYEKIHVKENNRMAIKIENFEDADFSLFDVKRRAAQSIGIDLDDDGSLYTTNSEGKREKIGQLRLPGGDTADASTDTVKHEPAKKQQAALSDKGKINVRVGDKTVAMRPETAALMATVPNLPFKKPSTTIMAKAPMPDSLSDEREIISASERPPEANRGNADESTQQKLTDQEGVSIPKAAPKGSLVSALRMGMSGLPQPLSAVDPAMSSRVPHVNKMYDSKDVETTSEAPINGGVVDNLGLSVFTDKNPPGIITTMHPEDFAKQLEDAMSALRIQYERQRFGSYECQKFNVKIHIEICRVGKVNSQQTCLIMHRIHGDPWVYKEAVSQLTEIMRR